MISRLHLSVLLSIAAAIWGVSLMLGGGDLSPSFIRPFSVVVGILVFLLSQFELWIWRLPPLRGWFVQRPNLRGTWRVLLTSNWRNPDTEQSVAPITGYLVVRQTYSSLSLRLLTAESSSELLGAQILRAEDGTFKIAGVYRNEPKLAVRHRSAIHYGGLVLVLEGNPPTALEGHYWTDRDTRGEIEATERQKKAFQTFDAANSFFGRDQQVASSDGESTDAAPLRDPSSST